MLTVLYGKQLRIDRPASFAGFNRNAVTSYSPGLPLRLPWEREGKDFQPQSGCVILRVNSQGTQPRCGWNELNCRLTLGRSAAATLGFVTLPLCGWQTRSLVLLRVFSVIRGSFP